MNIDCQDNQKILSELKLLSINSDREICGFIIKNDSGYSYKSCVNIHPDPINYFLIDPKECVFKNSILFHSHTINSNIDGFSEWDLENQKYFYLPMLLYSVNKDKFYYKNV